MFSIKQNAVWKNWSESVVAKPKRIVRPKTLGQLIALVKECRENNCTLRVVGAGHSFTPLAATDEVLVSLDHLNGIDAIDHENRLVTFWAGTRLKDVSRLLDERGYALENLGDINEQSIAGAISTGTHGTGIRFQSIPNQVEKLTLLTAHGELLEIGREQNDAYFEAARVSLGMLGIIVKVTLKVVPQYVLFAKNYRLSLEEGFQQLNALKEANRNVEFFWFPYTEVIQVKTLNEADEKAASFSNRFMSKVVMENGLFYLLSEMSRNAPKTAKLVSQISAWGVPVGESYNKSHLQYATPRLVKFNEMEYAVPEEHMEAVIRELDDMLQKQNIAVHFPVECRYVKGDSIWLSPSYERDSAYIGIHMYKGMELHHYFDAAEEIFLHYNGRPHWGKMHSLTYDQLKQQYPKMDAFLAIRSELDPFGLFLNGYLRSIFHI